MAMPTNIPHAVVFAWPGQGHLTPLLHFSELLVSHGFLITFVHTHHNLHRTCSNSSNSFRFVSIPDGFPPDHPRDVFSLIRATDHPSEELPTSFEKLVQRLIQQDETPVTCIVADFFMTFTQDVANKFSLPRIAVYVQSSSSFACHLAVADGFKPAPGDRVIDCVPGVPPFELSDMISFLQCYDPSDPLFDYMTRAFKRLNEPAWIVLNSFDELEHDVIQGLQMRRAEIDCVGPLLPLSFLEHDGPSNAPNLDTSLWPVELDCLDWLDIQAPSSVLYVSFGSLATLSSEQTQELAAGLENSQQPFMWAARPGSLETGLPSGFKERVEGRARMVSWAPQLRVLAHPSVGGFLTHWGWNSTLESIAAGVPMLGWSNFADQMLNGHSVVDVWGIGLRLEKVLSKEEVEEKVRTLMSSGNSMRGRCASLRAAAGKAWKEGRHKLVERVVASLEKPTPHVDEALP